MESLMLGFFCDQQIMIQGKINCLPLSSLLFPLKEDSSHAYFMFSLRVSMNFLFCSIVPIVTLMHVGQFHRWPGLMMIPFFSNT